MTLWPKPVLIVAHMRKYVSDDLASVNLLPVYHTYGLSALDPAGRPVAYWTSTEHAARLRRQGRLPDLACPDDSWMSRVPEEFTRREIETTRIGDFIPNDWPQGAFIKPAMFKLESLEAKWCASPQELGDYKLAAVLANVDEESWFQVTDTKLNFGAEFRCYVVAGQVTTVTQYLDYAGRTYSNGLIPSNPEMAWRFAQRVVDGMGQDQPVSYVLDVGALPKDTWAVVEANPVWSSAYYGADLREVVKALVAATKETRSEFIWSPDPYLVEYARKRRFLPERLLSDKEPVSPA